MPTIQSNGCPIYYEVTGADDAPALVLSNSLGTTLHMWDDQAPALAKHFRLIRYDSRGHGKSGAPKGEYTMAQLGGDALAVMDALGVKKASVCGVSKGGMVGMWLGANAPERIERLVLSNTSCVNAMPQAWRDRMEAVRKGGLAAIADAILTNVWFTKEFQSREPAKVTRMREMMLSIDPDGYIGCCAVVRDNDQREAIKHITAPTLVISGRHDPGAPVAAGELIKSLIPGAELVVLDTAHIANVEQPQLYTETLLKFLAPK